MTQNYKKDLAKFQILLMLHSYMKKNGDIPRQMNHLNLQLNLCKYFPDWPADTKICLHSSRCLTFINDHKIFSTEIINKSSCRINNKGCSPNDQHICLADRPDRTPDHTAVQALLIQNNIRLNDSSTDTSRNSFCFQLLKSLKCSLY